ncbi:MarR family winged helix-turn-helix transcriptional regulator [Streptomyces tauricus]|uniref:MarR family winged helix-turn-helix transcriptional regulator n=1 Tax=Streptomyces tauricus TaxID=68274 RepID=UPI002243E99D|nr:MarR family transcriptional regulator [Streptomyces tauricus]MCW8098353.1 MarR family transcriptional regulator [Streptomyces tauricus]
MPAPDFASRRSSREAARSAGGVAELLDLMWERTGQATAPAPASPSQLRLMYLVESEEGVRMRVVCEQLAAAPPSVSRLCDRLQAIGFLERLPCPASGREVVLRLTAAGRAHLRRVREQRETMLRRAMDAMSDAERRALAEGLAGLHAQLVTAVGREDGSPGTGVAGGVPGGTSAA